MQIKPNRKTPSPIPTAAPFTVFPFYPPLVPIPAKFEESRQNLKISRQIENFPGKFKNFPPNLKISRQKIHLNSCSWRSRSATCCFLSSTLSGPSWAMSASIMLSMLITRDSDTIPTLNKVLVKEILVCCKES